MVGLIPRNLETFIFQPKSSEPQIAVIVKIITENREFILAIIFGIFPQKWQIKVKTSTRKEYVFGCMSHPAYVISLSPQAE